MLRSKSLLLLPVFGYLFQVTSGQSTTQNNTAPLYVPLVNAAGGSDDAGVIVASSVSMQGSSTIFQLVESSETVTLALSPTGAHLVAGDAAQGVPSADVSCAISGGQSTCQLVAVFVGDDGTSVTSSTMVTETVAPVTVIAENFGAASSSSPTPTGAGASNPGPTSPAGSPGPNSSNGSPSPNSSNGNPSPNSSNGNPSPNNSNGNPAPTATGTPSPTKTSSATSTVGRSISLTFVSIIAFCLSWQFM